MVHIVPHTYHDWNEKKRPLECDYVAIPGDIVADIGGLWCCCETRGDTNFCYVFCENFSLKTPCYILLFAWYLRVYCGIEYIQLWSEPGRYDTFKKRYGGVSRWHCSGGVKRELYAFHISDDIVPRLLSDARERPVIDEI